MPVACKRFLPGLAGVLLASCGGGGGDGGGGNDDPPVDLAAALVAPGAVTPGQVFDYEVRLSASGGAAEDVVATLTLPDTVIIDVISDGGTATGRVVTWPAIATIGAGTEAILAVSVIAPPVGPLDASLEATTSTDEDGTANNDDTARSVLGFDAIATLTGESAGDFYGFVADGIRDITGDGVVDFVVGAPFHDANGADSGAVYVYSGADQALLHTLEGQNAGENLGWSAADAGDVDGDGTIDIVAGGPGAGAGVVRVFSGADGSPIGALAGPAAGARFGVIVAGLGDLDGDGLSDFLVGAEAASSGAGQAFVVSGGDGTTIRSHTGSAGTLYGYGIGAIGDVNGDGVPDYAIGGGSGVGGLVEARSGSDGVLLYTVTGGVEAVQLGFIWIDAVGDADGDGRPDFFASDINEAGNRGRGYLVSGASGGVIRTFAGEAGGEFFGIARHGGHDVDGDGIPDLFMAGYHNGEAAQNGGKAYVYSGATGELLRTVTGTGVNQTLGYDAVQLGDVDGDGFVDYLLTGDLESGQGPGRTYVVRGTPLP